MESNYFVLAIHKAYLDAIIDGRKKFEIRTRIPRDLKKGDWLFLVETKTNGKIQSAAKVKDIHKGRPEDLWREHQQHLDVTSREWTDYTRDRTIVYLIEFETITDVRTKNHKHNYITYLGLNRTPQWFQRLDMQQILKSHVTKI